MKRRAWIGFALGGFVVQAILLSRFFQFTADDAFIVARYSENLVRFGEFVFNRGERISALTSPLHGLLEALLYDLTGSTILASKVLSVAGVGAILLLALWHLRRIEEQALLFAGLVLPSPFLALWSAGGMETPYLLICATAVTILARRSSTALTPISAVVLSLLMGLSFLTRFDSALFTAPVAIFLLVRHPRRAAAIIAPGLALAAAWLAASWLYFHAFFPTSLYTKTPRTDWRTLLSNGFYVCQFMLFSGIGILMSWAVVHLVQRRRSCAGLVRDWLRESWWLPAGLLFTLLYALSAATTHMMFSYRLLVPYLPAMTILAIDLFQIGRRAAPAGRAAGARAIVALVLVLTGVHIGLAAVIWDRSLNPGLVGEYRKESLADYVNGFSQALADASRDIAGHWRQQGAPP